MGLVNAGLLVLYLFLNWRDVHSGWAEDRRWTTREVSRRRAAVLITASLLFWAVTALAIQIELSRRRPDWSFLLMIPTMLGLQVCLARRTELYQPGADAEPVPDPRGEPGA